MTYAFLHFPTLNPILHVPNYLIFRILFYFTLIFGWGIGSAIAASLAKSGCSIVGTDRSLSESVKENMEKIKEMLAIV